MITALDTNVLLDVLLDTGPFAAESRALLSHAGTSGDTLVSHVVYAELAAGFDDRHPLDVFVATIGATLSPIDDAMAWEASRRFRQYGASGGTRQRVLPDFLIGAHALLAADAFLTRDRGFFATYFPELQAVTLP